MADSTPNISDLSQSQREALKEYREMTQQDEATSIAALQRCQWNLPVAVTQFLDGVPADPIPDPVPAAQDIRRQEVLLNGIPSRSSQSRARNLQPAPRVVPQPESQVNHRAPLLLSAVLTPFNLIFGLFTRYFGFIGRIFPFLPRLWGAIFARSPAASQRRNTSGRRPLNPRDTAARFIREFEEEYGSHSLPFLECGYAQAFDTAKKDLKFLLVILLSPEHDDTPSYIRDTLLSPTVTSFLTSPSNNIIIWAGNVLDSEAYQVSTALSCTKFPFVGLICHTPSVSSTSMSVIARMVGPVSPESFVSKLRTAMSQNSEALSRVRAQRAEQQAARNLREQQDSAYERSLATDRERARVKREAEERQKKEEEEARRKVEEAERAAQNLAHWKQWRAQRLLPEPSIDVKDAVRVSIRMPSGERVVRKFEADAPIEELYAFVECYDVLEEAQALGEKIEKPRDYTFEYKFRLVSPMPREAYELEMGGTVKQRIGRSGNLIVESIEEESDEEAEGEENLA